jgi:RNA polymerase primary sigma factor
MLNNTSHYVNYQQETTSKYFKEIKKYNGLTLEQEKELLYKIKFNNDEEAKKLLVVSNLKYVISCAKTYRNANPCLSLDDLISEGNYGLVKAIEKFDVRRIGEIKFLSYAVWWIKQSMLQSIKENLNTIRIPTNLINELNDLKKHSSIDNPELELKLPVVKSLDSTIDSDGNSLHDVLSDMNIDTPDRQFDYNSDQAKKRLEMLLSDLDERERHVICSYFGLDRDEITLQNIADELDLTKERVRQIKEKAIKKLRNEGLELYLLIK